MAITTTRTYTFTRTELIRMQISVALRRTTFISEDKLNQVLKGIDNKWIKEFSVYAFDENNLCRAQLALRIDWQRHTAELKMGHKDVAIDRRWENNTAIELDESIKLFNSYVNSDSLWTEWRVLYTDEVYNDTALYQHVQQVLGLVSLGPIRWAGEREGHEYEVPELSEMKIGCFIVP